VGIEIENVMRTIPGTRSAYAERLTTGYFLDFSVTGRRRRANGLAVDDVQEVIESAVAG